MFTLVSTDDLGRKVVFPLGKIRTSIGRDASSDIVLPDSDVSREHARIYLADNGVEIKDAGSRNGVFVNNARIDETTLLAEGDEIIIGSNHFILCNEEGSIERDIIDQIPGRDGNDLLDESATDGSGIMEFPADAAEATVVSSREKMMAGIFGKKIALARYPSLEIVLGKNKGSKYLLIPGDYLIGAAPECNIRIDDGGASARHGQFRVSPHDVLYYSLDAGDTRINDRPEKRAVLRHGDALTIGGTKIRFIDPRAASTANGLSGNADQDRDDRGDDRNPRPISPSFPRSVYLWIPVGLGIGILILFAASRC